MGETRSLEAVVADALTLHRLWKGGRLGSETMPEDAHPRLERSSDRLAAYFTLGVCLNYQRNSYALWRAASVRLGLVSEAAAQPERVAARWSEALAATALSPIDMHTPLWLWSRAGFPGLSGPRRNTG